MPEAYSETRELLAEIRRLRPDWLRKRAERRDFMRLQHDWSKKKYGFWDRVRYAPDLEAQNLGLLGDSSILEAARSQATDMRKEVTEQNWQSPPPLKCVKSKFAASIEGWRGDEVEPWRVDGWSTTTRMLNSTAHAYYQWLHGEVDLQRVLGDRSGWLIFWLYEIDATAMPRFWLRWAFEFLQRFRKVSPGTPGDSQLATYLPEADILVSADRILLWVLATSRSAAPCVIPSSMQISAGKSGIDTLLSALSDGA